MQPLAVIAGALLTAATATALGGRLLGPACRDESARFVTGAAILCLVVFLLGTVHCATPVAFLAVGAGALLIARPSLDRPRWKNPWLLLFVPFFFVYWSKAMAPEASPDGAGYHLGLVGAWLRAHGFHPITDNFYAALSHGAEMLYWFAYAFGRHSAAALVHFSFLIALAFQMYSYARRRGFATAGACGAFLVFASPVVGVDATSAYNDVALAAVVFTLFSLTDLWEQGSDDRLLPAIGLVAGFAFAVKYTGWPAIPYALACVAWKSRNPRKVLIVAGAASLLTLPWLIRNWLWFQNPLAPFFNHWFPNPYITAAFEAAYRQMLALYTLKSRWQIPLEVTLHGSISGLLGPVFWLTPLALLAARRPEGRRLLLAMLVFGLNYFSNITTRFLIPPLPFAALALALALSAAPTLLVAIAILHAALSWPTQVRRYARPDAWTIRHVPWKEALRLRPEDPYLETNLLYYGVARMVERETPPGSSVFTFRPIPEAYTTRHIVVSFQAASNKILNDLLYTAVVPEFRPTWRVRFRYARQPLQGIRVVQQSVSAELWRIHELRIFDGVSELPRLSDWRLRAPHSPWHLPDAFDNSPLTFWISGELSRPGQTVEVLWTGEKMSDAVRIETISGQKALEFALEGRTGGTWRPLASPEISDAHAPLGLRRAAAEELKRRGVDFLLVFDDELGAGDFQRNPDLWGIRPVSEHKGARLYQLP